MPPTKTEIRNMTKAQMVQFACGFFEDTGNLRQEMDALNKDDLRDLLFNNGAGEEPTTVEEDSTPVVEAKVVPGLLDLGN